MRRPAVLPPFDEKVHILAWTSVDGIPSAIYERLDGSCGTVDVESVTFTDAPVEPSDEVHLTGDIDDA